MKYSHDTRRMLTDNSRNQVRKSARSERMLGDCCEGVGKGPLSIETDGQLDRSE